VFLIETGEASFAINPYNSAFMGLLAGLFTDLAYALLRDFAETIVAKLRQTFVRDPKKDASGNSDDAKANAQKPAHDKPVDAKPNPPAVPAA
jgi:hypothetical protein